MAAIVNGVLVVIAWLWTAILGVPLLVVIYARYAYGRWRAARGRGDVLDRMLEANAGSAGWLAQRYWAPVVLALFGVTLRIRELEPVAWAEPHVICANHASLFDAFAVIRAIPPPFRFVAKREILRWPIIGWLLRPAGQIVIDRADRVMAVASLGEAARRRIDGQVIFFVEGTRSRSGRLQRFKRGAFHFALDNQLPILPVAIRGSYDVLAKAAWWKVRRGRTIEVTVCRPISPEVVPAEDAVDLLSVDTHDAIAAVLATGLS